METNVQSIEMERNTEYLIPNNIGIEKIYYEIIGDQRVPILFEINKIPYTIDVIKKIDNNFIVSKVIPSEGLTSDYIEILNYIYTSDTGSISYDLSYSNFDNVLYIPITSAHYMLLQNTEQYYTNDYKIG